MMKEVICLSRVFFISPLHHQGWSKVYRYRSNIGIFDVLSLNLQFMLGYLLWLWRYSRVKVVMYFEASVFDLSATPSKIQ